MPMGAVAIATGGRQMQRKRPAVSRAYSLLATSETNLFVDRSRDVSPTPNRYGSAVAASASALSKIPKYQ